MNNTGVIDHFLDVFTRYIDSGFGLVGGDVQFLSATLIGIDITLAGLFWAMSADEDVIARLIKKTLYIGFFAFIIGNFNSLCRVVFESFSGLGLKAAGSALSSADFLRPGKLAQVGVDAGKPLLEAASGLMGYVSFFTNFVQIFVLLTAWVIVVVAFFILAVQLFITLIEFKLTTLAGFVLIPFALFNKTSFLPRKSSGTSSPPASRSWCSPSSSASAPRCSPSSPKASTAISRPSRTRSRSCWRRCRCSGSASSRHRSPAASSRGRRSSAPEPRSARRLPPAVSVSPARWVRAPPRVSPAARWVRAPVASHRPQDYRPRRPRLRQADRPLGRSARHAHKP